MRELKFKIWDEDTKSMSDPFVLDNSFDCHQGWLLNGVLLQFTGLHDKNGKGRDVYEDDLFEIVFKDCPDGFSIMGRETTVIKLVGRVVFKFGKFMLEFIHPETNEIVYTDLFEFLKNEQKEVIGNAYQHKHLLDEKK